jgi:NADH dehydrogenase
MDTRSVLVIGGSGFIGSHLIAKLSRPDWSVVVPTRHASHAQHLMLIPSVDDIVEADVHDDATLRSLIQGKDAVINLVGILHGSHGTPYGREFARAHVELPRRIVTLCGELGVQRYLHMSALGADSNGPSMYLRSKGDGEAAALSDPRVATTIFRPSVVFGDNDRFLNLFAALETYMPFMFLGGADAKFQPVYVEDVAQAFVTALHDDRDTIGKRYDLAGPNIYTLRELVQLAGRYTGHERPVIGLPPGLARMLAAMLEHMPGSLMSRDNLDSMQVDNIAREPIAPELGIIPTALEAVAPYYLAGAKPHSGLGSVPVRRG